MTSEIATKFPNKIEIELPKHPYYSYERMEIYAQHNLHEIAAAECNRYMEDWIEAWKGNAKYDGAKFRNENSTLEQFVQEVGYMKSFKIPYDDYLYKKGLRTIPIDNQPFLRKYHENLTGELKKLGLLKKERKELAKKSFLATTKLWSQTTHAIWKLNKPQFIDQLAKMGEVTRTTYVNIILDAIFQDPYRHLYKTGNNYGGKYDYERFREFAESGDITKEDLRERFEDWLEKADKEHSKKLSVDFYNSDYYQRYWDKKHGERKETSDFMISVLHH